MRSEIRDDAEMSALGVATKLNPDWAFLSRLRYAGQRRVAEWLELTFAAVGQASSVDINAAYL